jgi:hypothetical protein
MDQHPLQQRTTTTRQHDMEEKARTRAEALQTFGFHSRQVRLKTVQRTIIRYTNILQTDSGSVRCSDLYYLRGGGEEVGNL